MTWEPLNDDEAADQIGQGVHTGLRKGTDAPSAAVMWSAINDSNDGAWAAALDFAIYGLRSMGIRLCREVEP